jgi:hypothetical protein
MALRQKGAVDAREGVRTRIEEARAKALGRLGNDAQKAMFGPASEGRTMAAFADVDRHAMGELRAWNIGEARAGVEAQREAAVIAARGWALTRNEEQFNTQKAALQKRVADLAQREGAGEEQAQAMASKVLSDLHEAVITNFLSNTDQAADGGPETALVYLKQYRDEIESDRRDNITAAVLDAQKQKDVVLAGKLAADEAQTKHPDSYKKQAAYLQAQFKKASDEFGVRVFDAAMARLEKDHQRREAGTARWQAAAMGHFQQYVHENPGTTWDDYRAAHPNRALAIQSAGRIDSAKTYINSGVSETDPKVFRETFSMTDDDLRGMSRDKLEAGYRLGLSRHDFERLEARWARANQEDKQTERQAWLSSLEDSKRYVFRQAMGITTGARLNDAQTQQYAQFERYAEDLLQGWQDKTAKSANRTQIEALLKQAAMQTVMVDEFGRDPQRPLFALTTEEREDAYVTMPDGSEFKLSDIPPQDIQAISTTLIRNGVTPTLPAVIEMYQRRRGEDR